MYYIYFLSFLFLQDQLYRYFLVYDQTKLNNYRKALERTYLAFGDKSFSIQDVSNVINADLYLLMHPDVVEEDFYIQNNHPESSQFFNKLCYSRTHANPYLSQLKSAGFVFRKFYITEQIVKKFSIFQYYSTIPSKAHLHAKSGLTKVQKEYLEKSRTEKQSNECLKSAQFLKPSYDMQNFQECLQVMNILKTKKYLVNGQPIKYLLKYNTHLQQGVFFLDEQEANKLLKKVYNGKTCTYALPLTIQEYINNPVLLMKRAFTFRVYVLMASVHPPIAYIFDRSMFQVCAKPWNTNGARDSMRHLCNAAFAKKYFQCFENQKKNPKLYCPKYPDMADLEEHVPAPWLANITTLLINQGLVTDISWQEKYFYPKINEQIALIFNNKPFTSDPRQNYLWFGIDFEIDTNLDIWLLDFNTGPSLAVATRERYDMLRLFYKSSVKIVQHFSKQKYKQIKNFFDRELIKLEGQKSEAEISKLILKGTALKDEKKQFTHFRQLDFTQYPKGCKKK